MIGAVQRAGGTLHRRGGRRCATSASSPARPRRSAGCPRRSMHPIRGRAGDRVRDARLARRRACARAACATRGALAASSGPDAPPRARPRIRAARCATRTAATISCSPRRDHAHALPRRAPREAVRDEALQRLADRPVRESEFLAQLRLADALARRIGAIDDALAQDVGDPAGAREAIAASPAERSRLTRAPLFPSLDDSAMSGPVHAARSERRMRAPAVPEVGQQLGPEARARRRREKAVVDRRARSVTRSR